MLLCASIVLLASLPLLLAAAIVLAGVIAVAAYTVGQKKARQEEAARERALLVDLVRQVQQNFLPLLQLKKPWIEVLWGSESGSSQGLPGGRRPVTLLLRRNTPLLEIPANATTRQLTTRIPQLMSQLEDLGLNTTQLGRELRDWVQEMSDSLQRTCGLPPHYEGQKGPYLEGARIAQQIYLDLSGLETLELKCEGEKLQAAKQVVGCSEDPSPLQEAVQVARELREGEAAQFAAWKSKVEALRKSTQTLLAQLAASSRT